MKNETLLNSIKCALHGLRYALNTEKNYKNYFLIALTFLIINILLRINMFGHLCFIITTMGVFATECINTAIEHICNIIDNKVNEKIKIIKDISAAGVLCWGIAFFACEFIIIGCVLL